MPNLRRAAHLARVLGHGCRGNLAWVLVPMALGFALLFGISWNTSGLVVFGIESKSYRDLDEAGAKAALLAEAFSWAWIAALLGYVLPSLLLPLASSFSVSQTLWLRLTPCTPLEMALGRVMRLLGIAFVLGLLTLLWATLAAYAHSLEWGDVAFLALGLFGGVILSGGILLVVGPFIAGERGRLVLAVMAALAPLLLGAVKLAWRDSLPPAVGEWWPYAGPFLHALRDPWKHYLAATAGGFLLLALSLATQSGTIEWHRRKSLIEEVP